MHSAPNTALTCIAALTLVVGMAAGATRAAETEAPLEFSGGHDVGKDDFGRPVPLIAAALGVPPDDFRKAFSGVTPARGGPPSPEQARRNKEALLKVLGPLGVTNDRLDEVSDYYRYRPQEGELWPTAPAKGYAVVADGRVKKVVVTEGGSGYSSPPKVTVKGLDGAALKAALHFDKDFKKNGSVESVEAADAPTPPPADQPAAGAVRVTRLNDGPILRPDMMPKDDGEWSGDLNFPSVIRVPDWVEKPLGKYYLYFSAHHGSYVRLAYADQIKGPWKVYEPGTLRLAQVESVNGAERTSAGPTREGGERHVASPDVHVDDEHKQIRMYFHYWLPKLGHSSSVAFSADGLKFQPRPGAIAGPYLHVFPRDGAYLAIDDQGQLLRSPDGVEPFKPISQAVKQAAADAEHKAVFRHGGVQLDEDVLSVYFTRVGDAPERIMLTRLKLTKNPTDWQASAPVVVLEPERDYEGTRADVAPSTIKGQTNVRQLRDPHVFRDDGQTYLFYAVAGETGIAVAQITDERQDGK